MIGQDLFFKNLFNSHVVVIYYLLSEVELRKTFFDDVDILLTLKIQRLLESLPSQRSKNCINSH